MKLNPGMSAVRTSEDNLPPKVTSPSFKSVLIALLLVFGTPIPIYRVNADLGSAAFMLAFAAVIVYWNLWQRKQFRTYGYEWYSRSYPQHIAERGVRCRHCGSWKVTVRNLMNKTFHRAHVCTQCGRTLYYSPEN